MLSLKNSRPGSWRSDRFISRSKCWNMSAEETVKVSVAVINEWHTKKYDIEHYE
jgi:hypothetical protein